MYYKVGEILNAHPICESKSFGLIKEKEDYKIIQIFGNDILLQDTEKNVFVFSFKDLIKFFSKKEMKPKKISETTFETISIKKEKIENENLTFSREELTMFFKTLAEMKKNNKNISTYLLSQENILSISRGNNKARVVLSLPLDFADKLAGLLDEENFSSLSIVKSEEFFPILDEVTYKEKQKNREEERKLREIKKKLFGY